MWGVLLAYNLVRREMEQVAKEANVSPLRISFIGSYRFIRDESSATASPTGCHLQDLETATLSSRPHSCPKATLPQTHRVARPAETALQRSFPPDRPTPYPTFQYWRATRRLSLVLVLTSALSMRPMG